jgi:hypothetical protein
LRLQRHLLFQPAIPRPLSRDAVGSASS